MKLGSHLKQLAPHHKGRAPRGGIRRMFGRDPFFDWALIFATAFIVAALLVLLGVFKYLNIGAGGSAPAADSGSAYQLDTASLQKILGGRDSQEGLRSNLLHGYAGPGDPSL